MSCEDAAVKVRADPGAAQGRLTFAGLEASCALGRSGIVPAAAKREGDGTTPAGQHSILYGFYRADRLTPPHTGLRLDPLTPEAGWCDDPTDAAYNRHVTRPYPGSHEALWRTDERYDLLLVLGYNTNPIEPGRGSAIFLHICPPELPPTEGCVALAQERLLELVAALPKRAVVDIATV